jgi:hypothetical protein
MNQQSENINELMTALAKAQGKIQPAMKDKANPFFKSSYADLASVWTACRDALSENGLAVVQSVCTNSERAMNLITTLGHSSGQWIKSEMPIISQKQDPQSLGSAITYFRRYSLAAMVGVAPEEDDGEAAQAPYRENKASYNNVPAKKVVQKAEAPPADTKINTVQLQELNRLFDDCSEEFNVELMQTFADRGWATLNDIPESSLPGLRKHILDHIAKNKAAKIQVMV